MIGRRIADSATLLQEPVDGVDLRLTIDIGVQDLLEQEMSAHLPDEPRRRSHRA